MEILPDILVVVGAIGGIAATWVGIFYSIHRGIESLKKWFVVSVMVPFIEPLKKTVNDTQSSVNGLATEVQHGLRSGTERIVEMESEHIRTRTQVQDLQIKVGNLDGQVEGIKATLRSGRQPSD